MPEFGNYGGQGGFKRQIHDVSSLGLKCANEKCGMDIKELPFEPTKKEDGTYGKIYCRDCNRNRR